MLRCKLDNFFKNKKYLSFSNVLFLKKLIMIINQKTYACI